jgi:hypothetical protein
MVLILMNATHTDFHVNLQYFSNKQIVCWDSSRRDLRLSHNCDLLQAAAGIVKFARAHAANFVGCRPATLLASAMALRESEPRYVWASK